VTSSALDNLSRSGRFRSFVLALVSVAFLACGDDTSLGRGGLCEGPSQGVCFPGYAETSTDGSSLCVGVVGPSDESCGDGLDNDCDGAADEFCDRDGDGWFAPEDCQDRDPRIHPGQPERCNAIDDNCDGLIDNDPIDIGGLCFGGEFWRAANEPCRAGVTACSAGSIECRGEVLPTPERCGDRIDNDCNGLADDIVRTSTDPVSLDVVLLVDRSGSMGQVMPIIRSTLHAYVDKVDMTPELDVAYWMIDVPPAGNSMPAPNEACHGGQSLPLEQCRNVRDAIDELAANHGGMELSYDALWSIASLDWIEWRDGAIRIAFYFGDEEGQTLLGLNQKQVADALVEAEIVAHLFVAFFSEYSTIATDTGGGMHPLDSSIPMLFDRAADPGCR